MKLLRAAGAVGADVARAGAVVPAVGGVPKSYVVPKVVPDASVVPTVDSVGADASVVPKVDPAFGAKVFPAFDAAGLAPEAGTGDAGAVAYVASLVAKVDPAFISPTGDADLSSFS